MKSSGPMLLDSLARWPNPKITVRDAAGRPYMERARFQPGSQTAIAILEISPSRGLGSWRAQFTGCKYEGRRGGLEDPRSIVVLARDQG